MPEKPIGFLPSLGRILRFRITRPLGIRERNGAINCRPAVFWAAVFFSLNIFSRGVAVDLGSRKLISEYVVDIWTTDQGLPQNTIQGIVQTPDGYLWIATQEGLVRFDGVRFTTFDNSEIKELKENYILAITADNIEGLWIGTRGGGLSRYKDGKFSTYMISEGLASNFIYALCKDRDGNLWIGTTSGLNQLKNGTLKVYSTKDGLLNNSIISLCEDQEGSLWIGTDGGGLSRLKDGKFITYTTRDGLTDDSIRTIYSDREGRLWVGTKKGINLIENGKLTIGSLPEGFSKKSIMCFLEDRDGALWIGTLGDGLGRFRDGKITTFTTKDGLSENFTISLYEDHEGSLWVGSWGGGLNRLKQGSIKTLTTKDGLSEDVVRTVYEDPQGKLWIGTDGGGLNMYVDGRITIYGAKDGVANNFIRSLLMDRQGNLWIGTSNGLSRMKNGRFRTYSTRDGLSNDYVLSIVESSDGSLWIGTQNGLNRLTDGKYSTFSTKDGLSNNLIKTLLFDREGRLWIGTDNGLDCLNEGKFSVWTTKNGLAHDFIYSLYEDQEGILWIGTRGGLSRLKNGNFTAYTRKDGLFNDVIFQILDDGRGNFWMSCNKGIFRVSSKELNDFAEGIITSLKCVSYGVADGMKSKECNGGLQPASWRTRDGKLLFPTIKGVAIINPEIQQKKNDQPPPVLIEQVLVDETAIVFSSGQEVILPQVARKLEFHYTGLSFLNPERVKFKYQLEGFDEAWVDAGALRTAYYTNLPPGRYRFKVIACNNDGLWNQKGASFGFFLKPHLYQTAWFYVFCGLAVVLSAAGIFRWRVGRLKKHKEELEGQVEVRTAELGTANKELQREITERKKAEQAAQRRAAQAALLYKVGQRVSSKLELPALLSEIVTSIRDAFDYRRVMLFLLDEEENLLRLQSVAGDHTGVDSQDMTIELGTGLIGRAAASADLQVGGGMGSGSLNDAEDGGRAHTEIALPILRAEKIIGVLDIQSGDLNAIDETETAYMETLITQIAGAIENARLYSRAQKEIEERTRAEETIKAALKEKEVLLKEIHHRVKNNMQIISSLLRLQSARIQDKKMIDIFNISQSRIRSMALIHEGLYQSRDLAMIDFANYVEKLSTHLLSMFKADSKAVCIKVEAEGIHLDINQAIPCGLIINELVSNSLKHAFTESNAGEISIRMYKQNGKHVLVIKDSGEGFPKDVDFQTTKTLGLQIVNDLVKQIGGTIKLESGPGAEFIIEFV